MNNSPDKRLILFLGADWWGSDARALAMFFRQLGHSVIEVNYEDFSPSQWSSFSLRALRRIFRRLFSNDYNRAILRHLDNEAVDFLLVFKGKHLYPSTLEHAAQSGLPVYCFYPDVSFFDHGIEIWSCLPFYECLFTTKSFHLEDATLRERVQDLRLVAHGFDPQVHRPVEMAENMQARYSCDASFVGCWSAKKERILAALLEKRPQIKVHIWGTGWKHAAKIVSDRWQGRGAFGDELCLIYRASKINLGLLSEAGGGTRMGDQVTARTWQIHAAGGFMLHEHTKELERYFVPGAEAAVFSSTEELVDKTSWYIDHEVQRLQIMEAGHRRCLEVGYTYLAAANDILSVHKKKHPRRAISHSVVRSAPAPSEPLRILYIGSIVAGSTTLQRLHAFRSLGHNVATVTTVKKDPNRAVKPSFPARVRHRLLRGEDVIGANKSILAAVRKNQFDLIWIDKGLTIRPETLETIHLTQPSCQIVGFSPDDMMNPANQTRHFLRGLPKYDFYITTKSYHVSELCDAGCPQVIFIDNSFDPETHRPMEVTAADREKFGGTVGFIGQWEPDRAESLRQLALAGIPVRVWGYTWERMRDVPPLLRLENKPLWSADYAKAICAFDINLGFLRKCNRDLQTTRTMEIPACRAFMLAERTGEHQRLFAESQEAEYFGNDEELLQKVRHYLVHAEERQKIAQNAYDRCLRDGYSYQDRLRQALATIVAQRKQ